MRGRNRYGGIYTSAEVCTINDTRYLREQVRGYAGRLTRLHADFSVYTPTYRQRSERGMVAKLRGYRSERSGGPSGYRGNCDRESEGEEEEGGGRIR